jgi:FkbM family methyltransferase
MSNLTLNNIEIVRWFNDRGDYTHNITYDLNENSTIMDLGGYTGVWAQQMIDKYNPNVYIIEPVPEFYNGMVLKFKDNPKVKLLNVGVGVEDKDGTIFMGGDGTSSNLSDGEIIKVKLNTIDTILKSWGLDVVDLIQINIEGDEYPLLENMIETGSVNKFKNIQIQFHLGIENDIERRNTIRNGLTKNGFKNKFDYPFVWESWNKE